MMTDLHLIKEDSRVGDILSQVLLGCVRLVAVC